MQLLYCFLIFGIEYINQNNLIFYCFKSKYQEMFHGKPVLKGFLKFGKVADQTVILNRGRILSEVVTKDKFWTKTNFPAQIIKLHLCSYLVFINLKKMSSDGKKETAKNTPNKNSKENSRVITM